MPKVPKIKKLKTQLHVIKNTLDPVFNAFLQLTLALTFYLNVAELFTIWTWVNRSERLQGAPLVQGALTSQTPAGIHFG
jgi:hypothetical protein